MKVRVKPFIRDFTDGIPDKELLRRYELSRSGLERLKHQLLDAGLLTQAQVELRENNMGTGVIIQPSAPEAREENGVSVNLDTGLVLHCPSCAATVRRGASHCDYCKSSLDFSLKGKTIPCPHCFASTPANGRFCMRCASPITGVVETGEVYKDRLCPRCQLPMRGKRVGDFSLMECVDCGGFFTPHQTFEMMQDNTNRVLFPTTALPKAELDAMASVRYVKCPVCRTIMNRTNFARISGVLIDTCRDHGVWFDKDELEKIMDFIAKGGLVKAREKQAQELKEEARMARSRREWDDRWNASRGMDSRLGFLGVLMGIGDTGDW